MNGSEFRKSNRRWCSRRTQLEKILCVVILLMTMIAIILIILVAKKQADFIETHCDTQVCINEASKISKYVDPDVNPCDNFYDFACGKYLKGVHGDEKFALLELLKDQAKRQLLEGYMEPISQDDHKMVQASKKLFRACMNETEIQLEGLKTIRDALRSVGGWPVVEGFAWREDRFDWQKITYKLRKLGYNFKIFLDLSAVQDPDDNTKTILKISKPPLWDYATHSFNKIELMTDIAVKFGARNRQIAEKEMSEAHAFLVQLQSKEHNLYNIEKSTKYPVDLYQRMCDFLNWLDYINNITSPIIKISNNESVIFPSAEGMKSWFNLISLFPKRTQANYMMWKVVESVLPYLTDDLRNKNLRLRSPTAREDFCLKEIQDRFVPSPVEVMLDKRNLPKEKKEKVDELLMKVKNELIEKLEAVELKNEEEKKMLLKKMKSINFVVGYSGHTDNDKILNHLGIDMVTIKNNSLLNLIAQADRNRQSVLFSYVKNPELKGVYENELFRVGSVLPIYSEPDNTIFVPSIDTQDLLFDSNRSNYLNYGALGTQIGVQLGTILLNSRGEIQERLKCMEDLLKNEFVNFNFASLSLSISISEKISHGAYEDWLKNNQEEKQLIGVDYSPKQLFWISAAATFCQPISPYGSLQRIFNNERAFSVLVSNSMQNLEEFSQDFNCPANSKMNPSEKCQIL